MISEVETTYLEEELIRVEFPSSHLVSDHPVKYGGHGKGPSPGELLLAGLTSASLFSVRRYAVREGLDVGSVTVRAGLTTDREGSDGPLGPLSIISRLSQRIGLSRRIPAARLADLQHHLGFTAVVRAGVPFEESVVFSAGTSTALPQDWLNTVLQETAIGADPLQPGERAKGQDSGWRIHAAEIAPGRAIVQTSGAPIVVSEDGWLGSPTPQQLLFAGLAACTTIFVARNARFQNIPLESVAVKISGDTRSADDMPTGIEKITTVSGNLTAEQQARCRYFAEYCAVGESLKRGIDVDTEIVLADDAAEAGQAHVSGRTLDSAFSAPLACSDNSCCIA